MGVFGAFFGCIGDGGFNGCWSGACSGVVGFKVATGGVLRAKKFALRGLMVCVSAKKFALHAQNTQKSEFLRLLGEFFAETRLERLCWANFFAPIGPVLVLDIARRISGWLWWGICSIRSWLAGYLRRVAALMMQFPPFRGGGAASRGGVAANLQTHWAKRVQKRLFRVNGSTIWRNRSLSWCVVRASPPEHASQSLVARSSACRGVNRLTSCESCYTTVLSSNEAKSGRG